MKRREFCGKSSCALAGLMAAPVVMAAAQEKDEKKKKKPVRKRKSYKIDIEIYEARKDTWCHKKGEKFSYPKDIGKICPWLLSSMHDFIILLKQGVTLPWKYENTPYEKVIDPDGVTTEFIRCPDPTADLVAKITRTLRTG